MDATVVRMILVPAAMELLGDTNWWFPKWLHWLPVVHVDGAAVADSTGDPASAEDDREPVAVG
jgi:RND superfamily putative drug exporter